MSRTGRGVISREVLALTAIVMGINACGAGKVGEVVRPTDMTATEALQEEDERPSCRDVAAYGEPLVVDWRTQGRLDLELAMRSGLAVVAYDCRRFELLKHCKLEGSYSFAGVSRKEDVIQLETRDELAANLPLSGVKLSAGLDRGASIDLALVLVGKKSTTLTRAWRPQLSGERCGEATHFVRAATVGAFSVQTGSVGKARAVAEIFDAGISGSSSSERSSKTRDGSLQACRSSNPSDAEPPEQCRAAVRLELVPIVDGTPVAGNDKGGQALAPKENPCPDGMVLTEGKCTVDSGDPFLCDKADEAGCTKQCDGGHADSCLNLAVILLERARSEADIQAIIRVTDKACDGGNLQGCHASGFLYAKCAARAKGEPCVRRDPEKGKKLFRMACDGGFGRSCARMARDLEWSPDVQKHGKRIVELYERSCSLGYQSGCWDLSKLYIRGDRVPKDIVRGIQVLKRSCGDGHVLSCSDLAEIYSDGNYISKDHARAATYWEIVCDANRPHACNQLGKLYDRGPVGVNKDPKRARSLFVKACFPPDVKPSHASGEACQRLGEMYLAGLGGAVDEAEAARAFDRACTRGYGCAKAGEVLAKRAVELLARGCERLAALQPCEELEKQDPQRARQIYDKACKPEHPKSSPCKRLRKLPQPARRR